MLDAEWDVADSLGAAEPLVRALDPWTADGLEAGGEVGLDEHQGRGDGCEHERAGKPPPRSQPAGERHQHEERERERDERPGEPEPAVDEDVDVST